MQFRALGLVGAVDDDGTEIALGGSKQRLVLALLLSHANAPVSRGRLIDDMWGEEPPPSARNTLQTYVSQLRKALGAERIETSAAGYRIVLGPEDEFDAHRFADALAAGDVDHLSEVLARWTGPPYADFVEAPALVGEIARLDDLRGAANEVVIDVELAAGRHPQVIGRLAVLTEVYPFRERLWAQLMIAYYRSARQADALRTYERARKRLVEQLGVEPGPELRKVHASVLSHDEVLAAGSDGLVSSAAPTRIHVRRVQSRAVAAAFVIAGLLAGAGVVAAISVRKPSSDAAEQGTISVSPSVSAVIVDAATREVAATIDASQMKAPVESIFDGTDFWVLNLEPLSFVQVDGISGAVLRQIASPVDDVGSFAVDGDDLWITHYTQPTVVRVDVQRGIEVARSSELPGVGGSAGVVVADGALWVARPGADESVGALVRLDPDTLEPVHEFRRQPGSVAVATGDGAVWTTGPSGHTNRVDLGTGEVTTAQTDAESYYVTAGGGYGWISDEYAGVVHQIDKTGRLVATHATGAGARSLWHDDGVIWVGNQDAGTITGISTDDGTQTSLKFDRPVQTVAAGNGRVLVLLASPLPPAFSGEMFQLFIPPYQLDPLDPALLQTPTGRQVLSATCGGLVRHGESGVESDLTTEPPEVSADGRTYRFTIRPEMQFSPPSGAPIDAQTFKTSLERALAPRLGPNAPGVMALHDLLGLDAYRSGAADEVAGIAAEGLELTLTLRSPSDDLLDRLADPSLCAVDAYAATDLSLAVPTGGTSGELALPSAGPYYVSQALNGEYLVLVANPNYRGTRQVPLEGLALREGVSYEDAIASMDVGRGDGITGLASGETTRADQFSDRVGCVSGLPVGIGLDPQMADLATLCRRN